MMMPFGSMASFSVSLKRRSTWLLNEYWSATSSCSIGGARYQGQPYGELLQGIRSAVKLPILIGPERVGVLCLHRRDRWTFNERVVRVLKYLAERIGTVLSAEHRRPATQLRALQTTVSSFILELIRRPMSTAAERAEVGTILKELA